MKSVKYFSVRILFIMFLITVFISGIFVCLNGSIQSNCSDKKDGMREYMDNQDDNNTGPNEQDKTCPTMLIKKDNTFLLINSNIPEAEGINPIKFASIDEYIKYLEEQKIKGIHCPVLYLQQESDTQGNDVFRMRPSPFIMDGGLQPMPMFNATDFQPVKMIDATTEDPNYNQNQYAAFDPTSMYVGKITDVDIIHYSTETNSGAASENAMDPNWGGVMYTQDAVNSHKYDDNNIYKVVYPHMGPK